MDYKPVVFNELNRLRDDELLQMSKNDTIIRLIAERNAKGKIIGKELGGFNANTTNQDVWETYYDMTGITLGVGRIIQIRLIVPWSVCDPDSGYTQNFTSLSFLRAYDYTMHRSVAWHQRQYNPMANDAVDVNDRTYPYLPASGGPAAGDVRGDMRQSVFMMGVFPTFDLAVHDIKIEAKATQGKLYLSEGAYLTVEDMGAMPSAAPIPLVEP